MLCTTYGYITYRVLLGQDKTRNPSLGLRLGGSIVPVEFSGTYNVGSELGSGSNNETKFGSYIGADILVPIQKSPLFIFLSVEKTFCTYRDANIGALTMSAGLAYAFNFRIKYFRKRRWFE